MCEEFNETGKCPRGSVCPLSHRRGKNIRKKSVTLEPTTGETRQRECGGQSRKRKRSETRDVLGGPKVKRKTEKNSKVNRVEFGQSRYFQVMTESVDTKVSNISMDVTDVEKGSSIEKGSSVGLSGTDSSSLTASFIDDRVTRDQRMEGEALKAEESSVDNIHDSVSSFNEVRQRVLEAVDKMKTSYATFTDTSHEQSKSVNDKQSKTKENSSCSLSTTDHGGTDDSNVDDHTLLASSQGECSNSRNVENGVKSKVNTMNDESSRLQRPPLPKCLPSYIPLTLDGDD